MRTIRRDALRFADAPMPGGSGPVQLARLPDLGDGVFRAFVRFPSGWSRPAVGHYPVSEEVFVFEGDLTFNASAWRGQSYGFIPGGITRYRLESSQGATVIAWFGGAPQWKRGPAATASREAMTSIVRWQQVPAHRLRGTADAPMAWIEPTAQPLTAARDMECVSLADQTWTHLRAGESIDLNAPVVCRVV